MWPVGKLRRGDGARRGAAATIVSAALYIGLNLSGPEAPTLSIRRAARTGSAGKPRQDAFVVILRIHNDGGADLFLV